MNQPSLDELLEKVDSRYTLVVVAAKRARELTERGKTKADGAAVMKPVTAALMEIAQNKVGYKRTRSGIK
ncbi:MAG: DNA-directed RNA polymerase subunit omega [Pelotomaculum sp.]|uniref:DNA-directed RNA polymerase subunit omega n=1 Tax=Pelotomaculum thermopropionicum (strain DSM 13744 / JCM 10971 / SI) TaxID=370438 RepID=RPOZ_PELTS|nr:RecName: Full=DNA-directed RNA polymerase subunit omega; Short=RNAP omega subunit; AltName: Full=RNA polymerase omega subunit; AltName: Full=Transcriptase subunit omega [Pelotomaculum thermopropionicum SI]NPV72772.1 DNA-directed RNA polymerase subunit omega [Pelotomaculum sp.]BAF59975.1 DNA-directed RNA polymerase, subunit K/omega [Pelotomaculum thermopropionicum SI]